MNTERPLKDIPLNELELELALRAGPRYQCQARECRSLENAPAKFDTCPACSRKGFLGGGFVRDPSSPEWKAWEERMISFYRDEASLSVAA